MDAALLAPLCGKQRAPCCIANTAGRQDVNFSTVCSHANSLNVRVQTCEGAPSTGRALRVMAAWASTRWPTQPASAICCTGNRCVIFYFVTTLPRSSPTPAPSHRGCCCTAALSAAALSAAALPCQFSARGGCVSAYFFPISAAEPGGGRHAEAAGESGRLRHHRL